MRIELCDEALEFGRSVHAAIASVGGDSLVQQVERDGGHFDGALERTLGDLGVWDLDPLAGDDELEASAALCRSVGSWGVSNPVAERLARLQALDVDGLLVVDDARPRARVAGLDLRWAAVTLDGRWSRADPQPLKGDSRHAAMVVDLDLEDLAPAPSASRPDIELALALVLPVWTLLGMLDRAIALTCDHVRERHQFGRPLATFQGVQFQLTEAEVERAGVEELAKYALWSIQSKSVECRRDALALRLAAIEAADVVFRVAHQLHGAIGFCDETQLSWLSRYSQPLRALPVAASGTLSALREHLGRDGLSGLFDDVTM